MKRVLLDQLAVRIKLAESDGRFGDAEDMLDAMDEIQRLEWMCKAKDEANRVLAERNAVLFARLTN